MLIFGDITGVRSSKPLPKTWEVSLVHYGSVFEQDRAAQATICSTLGNNNCLVGRRQSEKIDQTSLRSVATAAIASEGGVATTTINIDLAALWPGSCSAVGNEAGARLLPILIDSRGLPHVLFLRGSGSS